MQISCPNCSAQYNVDESRIPPQGVSIKCPRCQNTFLVGTKDAGAVPLPGSSGGAIPLPGAGANAPVPLPGAGGAPPAPRAAPAGAPVPLPGMGGGAAVPLPGMGGGAVPLPGGGGGVPLPGSAPRGGAVPLPGGGGSVPLPGGGGSVPLPGGGGSVPLPGAGPATVPLPGGGGGSLNDIFGTPKAPPRVSTPPPLPGGGAPSGAPRSASLSDIFGDVGGGGGGGNDAPPHPFHGTNSVMVSPSQPRGLGDGLLDFIDQAGKADAPEKTELFRIRKRSGRIIGPFDAATVLAMFQKGELLGSEEASTDDVSWKPLAQVPAFAETIQRAMASALSGLDDLPTPKGQGDADLPVPKKRSAFGGLFGGGGGGGGDDNLPVSKGHDNLPVSKGFDNLPASKGLDNLPVPRGETGFGDPSGELSTGALRDAEQAKERVARRRSRGGVGPIVIAGVSVVLLVGAVGVAANFLSPYGWFFNKLVFKDPPPPPPPPKKIEAPPPPPPSLPVEGDVTSLLALDTYVAARQGADSAGRTVEAGKAQAPVPASAKAAATLQARFLSQLIVLDQMPAFSPQLEGVAPLIDDASVKAIATASLQYNKGNWDKGMEALRGPLDPATKTPLDRLSDVHLWNALGLRGKGDLTSAIVSADAALQANTKNTAALWLQAELLSKTGAPDAALEYVQKVIDLSPEHSRALLLRARLWSQRSGTLEEGLSLFKDISEGELGKSAAPATQADAFMGRAEVAVAQRNYPEALKLMNQAVNLMPSDRRLRIQAGELALRLRDYNVAKENYKKLLETSPDDVDAAVGLARAKMGTKDSLNAYTDLQAALRKKPEDANLNYWFGVAAREILKLDEARTQFEKAAKLDPKRPEPVIELVIDAVERGKLTDALTRAESAEAAIDPGALHRLRTARAIAYTRKRQFEQAEKELQKAIDENPRDADARAAYASTLVVMRRYEDAEKQVTEAAVWDQKNPAVLIAQGDLALGRGEPRAALEHYEEAMQVVPNAHAPYLRAAIAAVTLKDIARAKGFADTAGQLRPGIAEVLGAQAAVQEPADPKAAARLYEQARELSPEDPYYPYALGAIFQKIGAFLEAIDSFKQATALDPDYGDAYFALGRVYRELGRNTEAKNAYTDVTRIDPRRADAWIEIADLLATIGDVPEALKAYDKAIEVEPKNAAAVCSMGETLVVRLGDEMKNLRRGTEVLERCVKMKPKHQTAWKYLGNAYKTFNKKKDAVRAFKEHLKVAPDDVENPYVRDFITDLGGKL